MKSAIFTGVLVFASIGAFAAPPAKYLIDCERKNDMFPTRIEEKASIAWVDGGKTGKCMRMQVPASHKKDIGYLAVHTNMIPVASASTPIKYAVYLKGKGSGTFGFLCYDRKNKRIFYPGGIMRKFEIDSPDQWVKKEFTFVPEAGKDYANKIGYITPYIAINQGGDVRMDDLSIEFVVQDAGIKIEE